MLPFFATPRLVTCRFAVIPSYKLRLITSGARRKLKEKGIIKKRRGISVTNPIPLNTEQQQLRQPPAQGVSPWNIFFALFPLAAAATVVATKPELQEQVKANWGAKNGSMGSNNSKMAGENGDPQMQTAFSRESSERVDAS